MQLFLLIIIQAVSLICLLVTDFLSGILELFHFNLCSKSQACHGKFKIFETFFVLIQYSIRRSKGFLNISFSAFAGNFVNHIFNFNFGYEYYFLFLRETASLSFTKVKLFCSNNWKK